MPQLEFKVRATGDKEAVEEAHAVIARILSNPLPPDNDLLNAVKSAYTAISVQEHDRGQYRVIMYGSVLAITRYRKQADESKE